MNKPLNFLTPVQAIIFDCDGVLFDSRRANQCFYNHLLTYFGKPALSEADLSYVHMHTASESIGYLFRDDRTLNSALAYTQTIDYTPFIRLMDMEPGLIEFLDYIRPWAKTAISTNRTTTIGQVLSLFALNPYFDLVVSALDVSRPKPDPESLFKIITHFNIKPEQCLFIGDSEIDAQTAFRAGVPLVAYKNAELTAGLSVQGFEELTDHLKRTREQ